MLGGCVQGCKSEVGVERRWELERVGIVGWGVVRWVGASSAH